MKLEKILENLNSFEKNSFLKIIDGIISQKPKNASDIDKILSEKSRDLKNVDNINVAKVFALVEKEFGDYIKEQFVDSESQFDILIDIISRDGNCIMKQDWFARLYEKELEMFDEKLRGFKSLRSSDRSELDEDRRRDYNIYSACLYTAYHNDEKNNLDNKITNDEQEILTTLSVQLGLSQEEVKLLNYEIIPIKKASIDSVINELRALGAIFYSKKTNTIYVADEVVRILRKTRGKEVGDKFFRRVLRSLREPQINLICKRHNINWRLTLSQKIRSIISEGISFSLVLTEDIYKVEFTLSEKKQFLNEFFEKELRLGSQIKGATIEEKITNLIAHFEKLELDEHVGISIDGYDKLLGELDAALPVVSMLIKEEFQLQEDNVLNSEFLLSYNIKPRDILELIAESDLVSFVEAKTIKSRGDLIENILETFKDAENLYLENYENIGFRNLGALKQNGIDLKEADIGLKYEELTKTIFLNLGFAVDEDLRRSLSTEKDRIDIVLNLGNMDLILVECKTSKESGYNKFSSVSRQLKSYSQLLKSHNYKVIKVLLVAPEFSEEFVKDCGLDYELNLSLLTSTAIVRIMNGFKGSRHKKFPHNLLMRDVLIQEERVLAAIDR
jgi:hypothetical protein